MTTNHFDWALRHKHCSSLDGIGHHPRAIFASSNPVAPMPDKHWDLEGGLQKNYKRCIFPEINRVLKVFFGPDGKGEAFSLHGYMIGTRRLIAKPTILLIGKDDKTRKEAMKAVRDSKVLSNYPEWQFDDSREFPAVESSCAKSTVSGNLAEVEFWSSSGPIMWRDAENSHIQAIDVYIDLRPYSQQPSSMPSKGLAIYINHVSSLRMATANIVKFGNWIFLQTVYHSFQPTTYRKAPTETDVIQNNSSVSSSKQELTLVGRLLVWSVARDWALIEITNEDMLSQMSRMLREEAGARYTFQEAARPSDTDDPVYTWTASCGRTRVTLLETTMYLKLPNSDSFEEVYKAYLENGSWSIGDSGAVVMRPSTKSTIGHVLGGDRAAGVALILAADEVVEDFKELDFSSHLQIGVSIFQQSGMHESVSESQSTETRGATEVSLDEPSPEQQTAEQKSPRKELLQTADLVFGTLQSSSKQDSGQFESPRNIALGKQRAPYFKSSSGLFDPYEDEEEEDKPNNRELVTASLQGHEKVVKLLLDHGADVNAQSYDRGSALSAASRGGHEKVVELLLDHGADVNKQDGIRGSALLAASHQGHEKVVKLLLDHGADVNAQSYDRGSALSAASRGGHEKVVKLLLDHGADINARYGLRGSALSAASRGGHEKVVKLLLDHGADVNAQNRSDETALIAASEGGHEKVVKLLLDHGADIRRALLAASIGGHEKVVKLLLDHGADVNAQDGSDETALSAVSRGGHEKVVKLLLDHGADVNAQDGSDENALIAASYQGHEKVVKLLLDHGADVNAQDRLYGSALSTASMGGHDKVVSLLLASGAQVTTRDKHGRTPLLLAAKAKSEETVKYLVTTNEVDPDAEDDFGLTPLFWASFHGQKDMIRCLREHMKTGAEVERKLTSVSLSLQDGHILNARFTNDQGLEQETRIDLDEILGNKDGVFEWGWQSFSHSASDVRLSSPFLFRRRVLLKALLRKRNGEYTVCQIDLAKHLYISNGHFMWFDQA